MWRRSAGFGLFAVVAAITSVIACRQLVGITDNPPEDLVTSICGLPYGTNTCASCVSASCCAESTACASDPACAAYEGCLGKCNGDPKCRSQCTTYPVSTASDVSSLSACLASNCEMACGLACGGIANLVTEPPSATSCQSCIEETPSICADARAWGTSVAGDAYWRCVLACPTEDCRLTCAADHATGAALYEAFQPDYAGTCSGPCAYGNYWACVGHVNWPVAKSKTWKDTVKVSDTSTQVGVPGLDLSICAGCPCGVANPVLKQAQTDDGGVATYVVPQVLNENGIGQGIGLDGCAQVTSPTMSYIPLFAYWGWPISEPVTDRTATIFGIGVTTPDEFATNLPLIHVTQDPMRGWVAAVVYDCLGSPAPGVQVTPSSNDMLINTFYYQPVGSEVESTQSSGTVIFFNVPPGLLTLTATPGALDKASSQVTVNVAAGTETAVYMFPTPNP
jgi:hypothetical protein